MVKMVFEVSTGVNTSEGSVDSVQLKVCGGVGGGCVGDPLPPAMIITAVE